MTLAKNAIKEPLGRPLTAKQGRFIRAYAQSLNGTQAVLDAGYVCKDREVAGRTAWRVMKNPQVRAAIIELESRSKLDNGLSAKRVLEELRRIAFLDVRELYDADGVMKPMKDWTVEHGAAVQQLEVVSGNADKGDGKRDRVLRVKTWDKTKALEMLAKHYALTVERTEISGGITVSWLKPEDVPVPAVVEGTVVRALPSGDEEKD